MCPHFVYFASILASLPNTINTKIIFAHPLYSSVQMFLTTLPRELRDQIYSHYFEPTTLDSEDPDSLPVLTATSFPTLYGALAPLCTTNTQLYYETLPIYLGTVRLTFSDTAVSEFMQKWLSSLPVHLNVYDCIRSLDLGVLADEKAAAQAMDFVMRCVNLRSLKAKILIKVTSTLNVLQWVRDFIVSYHLHRNVSLEHLSLLDVEVLDEEATISRLNMYNSALYSRLSEVFSKENKRIKLVDWCGDDSSDEFVGCTMFD